MFLWDTEFEQDPAGHRLRPLVVGTEVAAATFDITPWLEALLDRAGYIEISGIGSDVGRTRDASRYPIEQLYTTLRSRDAAEKPAGRSGPVSLATLAEIWNEFAYWKKHVERTLPEEERLFSTKMNGLTVWVIEDAVAFTLMYPEDY